MDATLFGSTNSLGGLLPESFLDGEGDSFLNELAGPTTKGFELFGSATASESLESDIARLPGVVSDSNSGGLSGTPPISAALFPASFPNDTPTATKAWPAPQQPPAPHETAAKNFALLAQLIGLVSAAQPQPQQQQQDAPNLVSQFATAFKPSPPPLQAFAPISQTAAATQPPVQAPSLPGLSAQQQATLQAFLSLGQMGNTSEGKKVRRMLSNRESARRSRHRKQAHVQDLEEKAARLEVENLELKQSVALAVKAELQSAEERARLTAQLATLHQRIDQLEGNHSKVKTEKLGNSHASSAGAAPVSDDSSCDSMPAAKAAEAGDEPCCKRCRTSN